MLLSTKLAISRSFKSKKVCEEYINESGPNIDPWGTPSLTSNQSLNEFPILVRCLLLDK